MSARVITDSEIRIGIGKWKGDRPPADGPWYVTRYSRNLIHDRAEGWYPTFEEASAASRSIIEGERK